MSELYIHGLKYNDMRDPIPPKKSTQINTFE